MKTKRQKIVAKLDKLWADKVKEAGQCARCHKQDNLQAAHIFSRSHYGTRWSLLNSLCLCAGCHIFFAHKNPIEFSEMVRAKLGEEKYQKLRQQAEMITKFSTVDLEIMCANWGKW